MSARPHGLVVVLLALGSAGCLDGQVSGGTGGGGAVGGGAATGGGSATGGGTSTGGGSATGGGGSATGGGMATGGGSGGGAAQDAGTVYLPDPVVTGRVLTVCASGCGYTLPSLALAAAVDGDTIEVRPGDYVDCATIMRNNLVLRGVLGAGGVRPRVHSRVCGRKGIFVVQSASVLIENLELDDAIDPTTQDENWACVRLDSVAGARNLKLRNVWLHHADNGLLGNNVSTAPNVVVVEDSLLEQLGRAGFAHGVYLGTAVDLFVLRNSVVRSNRQDGHLVKSRARRTIVECSTVAALEGVNSFAVDLPQGGEGLLRHNVLHAGPRLSNGGNFFVNFAEENGDNAPHALTLTDNWLVNDHPAQGRVNLARPAVTTGWSGNRYVGAGAGPLLVNYGGPAAFTSHATRAAAGLGAYDGTMASLPVAPRCP